MSTFTIMASKRSSLRVHIWDLFKEKESYRGGEMVSLHVKKKKKNTPPKDST